MAIPEEPLDGLSKASTLKEGPTIQVEDMSMTIEDMLKSGPSMTPVHMEDDRFLEVMRDGYMDDLFFKLIIADPMANHMFKVKDGMIWMRNAKGDKVVCVLKGLYKG